MLREVSAFRTNRRLVHLPSSFARDARHARSSIFAIARTAWWRSTALETRSSNRARTPQRLPSLPRNKRSSERRSGTTEGSSGKHLGRRDLVLQVLVE